MTTEDHRPSSKTTRAPFPPSTLNALQSSIPINPTPSKPIIKDLRRVNLLDELYHFDDAKTHVQETVEIIPQPVSYERIFYSYVDDRTDLRSREDIKLDQNMCICPNDNLMDFYHQMEYEHRFELDFYSTTLYIFPKQRNEKFISEIHYIPEHITVKYKTKFELLSTTLTSSSQEHYYQNIQDFYQIAKDIFYRI